MDNNKFQKSTNSTSKMIMSGTETLVLNSQTQKLIQDVQNQISDMYKRFDYDCIKLLNYAVAKGTPVIKLKDAATKLQKLGLEEGLIFELDGLQALKFNLTIKAGFSFSTIPMFVFEDAPLAPFSVLHQFYKWYSYSKNLPGFDKTSQKLFRMSLTNSLNMSKLNLNELAGLKEAIHRDQEATNYTLALIKEQEAAKKLKESGDSKA